MVVSCDVANFLNRGGVYLDVRSPAEYEHAHIPGAYNIPLFTNEERAIVGTCYKHEGKDAAVTLGLKLAGPKFYTFVEQAKIYAANRPAYVYCWRGGMRSQSIAFLLDLAGLKPVVLKGGYKSFRSWVLQTLEIKQEIITLGGLTGSGKTDVLHSLRELGEQTIDLEDLAFHRGSSYGSLPTRQQPSTEHYENLLAIEWSRLNLNRPVWLEDESRMVGSCCIPSGVFTQMKSAPLLIIQKTMQERIAHLYKGYHQADPVFLIEATLKLEKRLGHTTTQEIISLIQSKNLYQAIQKVLSYYDKTYEYALTRKKQNFYCIDVSGYSNDQAAKLLIEQAYSIF
ncbi:MAG: tRNA 2-selenouridine synthase [Chlamydiales bacterium]|jgi:tRNA 2-selenouridine synthase|nr:tRNA 2-selenouridine synthase [Chlamydiales bacterium]